MNEFFPFIVEVVILKEGHIERGLDVYSVCSNFLYTQE